MFLNNRIASLVERLVQHTQQGRLAWTSTVQEFRGLPMVMVCATLGRATLYLFDYGAESHRAELLVTDSKGRLVQLTDGGARELQPLLEAAGLRVSLAQDIEALLHAA